MRTISSRRRRGTAEIELMLAIPVLLAVLYLIGLTFRLGAARMLNVAKTEEGAYRDATTADPPVHEAANPAPIQGSNSVRPELPLRMHEYAPQNPVDLSMGSMHMRPVTVRNRALFISPAWAYSAYPFRSDENMQNEWFQTYVDEAHGSNSDASSVSYSLGLADSFPP